MKYTEMQSEYNLKNQFNNNQKKTCKITHYNLILMTADVESLR